MTDQNPSAPSDANPEAPASFLLRSQYIKDLSFENPRAPGVFAALNDAPAIDVQLNLTAQRIQPQLFELSMHIAVRATHDKQTVFLLDLVYAGLFEAVNSPDEQVDQAILVPGAVLLFP